MELLHSLVSNIWSLFLVVFFFGSSIFVHELGHFLAARRRGVRVERFCIGMGKTIWSRTGRDGVEYCIACLPIGGYVKLPQLADLRGIEGESTLDLAVLPPLSYSTKLIVFVAGAVFNVIFAFFLASILWAIGFPTDDNSASTQVGYVAHTIKLSDGTKQTGPAEKAGLKVGDVILSVDGHETSDWLSVRQALALGSGRTKDGRDRLVHLEIRRGNETIDLDVNPVIAGDEKLRQIGVAQAHSITLGRIPPASLAEKIGFKAGDRIEAMDTQPILSLPQLDDYLESHSASGVSLEVQRGPEHVLLSSPPGKSIFEILDRVELASSMHLAHENPVKQIRVIAGNSVEALAGLVNPRSDVGLSKMSGPIGIVTQFWDAANSEYPIRVTIWFTILINISLALFNLLPIPVLDGGNIVFATIAQLRGRALPIDFINAAQSIFVVLLFSMLIYVSYFDLRRNMHGDRTEKETPAAAAPSPIKR